MTQCWEEVPASLRWPFAKNGNPCHVWRSLFQSDGLRVPSPGLRPGTGSASKCSLKGCDNDLRLCVVPAFQAGGNLVLVPRAAPWAENSQPFRLKNVASQRDVHQPGDAGGSPRGVAGWCDRMPQSRGEVPASLRWPFAKSGSRQPADAGRSPRPASLRWPFARGAFVVLHIIRG